MRSFSEYVEARERELDEGIADIARGTVAGIGNLGHQAIRGTGNALVGTGQAGLGAIGIAPAIIKGFDNNGWETAAQSMHNLTHGTGRAIGGVAQAGLAPISAIARAVQAGRSPSLKLPSAPNDLQGKAKQFFGLASVNPNAITDAEIESRLKSILHDIDDRGEDRSAIIHRLKQMIDDEAGDGVRFIDDEAGDGVRESVSHSRKRITPAALAKRFHETYERLAPSFNYKTRKSSAKPWKSVPDNNKKLMIAVCREILRDLDLA